MNAILVCVITFVCLAASSQLAAAQSSKTDFEISFLAENFAAFRLPSSIKGKAFKAGDLVSAKSFVLQSGLDRCTKGSWDRFYDRGARDFELRSRSNSRSGRLEANVTSRFSLGADVSVATSSTITDKGSLVVESDNARVEQLWAEDDIKTDDPRCEPYLRFYAQNYLPEDVILIESAYYFAGDMFHAFSISLEGSGSATISSGQITEFLNAVPFLRGLSDLFKLDASLEVGGASLNSDDLRYDYGQLSSFPIGFRPTAIQREQVRRTLELVEELPDGESTLIDATEDPEQASSLLEDFPDLNLAVPGSTVSSVFVGESLITYATYLEGSRAEAIRFAAVFSRIAEVNDIAIR